MPKKVKWISSKARKVILAHRDRRRRMGGYSGDKKGTICPRCGARGTYAFWRGRVKSCIGCGLDNFMEKTVEYVKYMLRRGRESEMSGASVLLCLKYIRSLKPVTARRKP